MKVVFFLLKLLVEVASQMVSQHYNNAVSMSGVGWPSGVCTGEAVSRLSYDRSLL